MATLTVQISITDTHSFTLLQTSRFFRRKEGWRAVKNHVIQALQNLEGLD